MAVINSNGVFRTDPFFVGGNGYFIQYHDILKPVWLYAVIKMIVNKESYGLPIDIIQSMSIGSIIEWYKNRRYVNPLKQLDWANEIPNEELEQLMKNILLTDNSIYKLCPMLNMSRVFSVYRQQHMAFPIYVYTQNYEAYVKEDCKNCIQGINVKYIYGDLKEALKSCDQNFTYIFSDIELVKQACEILNGTYSHILMSGDYRYNYIDFKQTPKYDMKDLMFKHPFVRLGTTSVWDRVSYDVFSEIANP